VSPFVTIRENPVREMAFNSNGNADREHWDRGRLPRNGAAEAPRDSLIT
jgi:hypothetical protein